MNYFEDEEYAKENYVDEQGGLYLNEEAYGGKASKGTEDQQDEEVDSQGQPISSSQRSSQTQSTIKESTQNSGANGENSQVKTGE
jgi:hypothetical protein